MAVDADFSSVVLYAPFDGTNGSTTFYDISPSPKALTGAGGVSLSTSAPNIGGASAFFDGVDDNITTNCACGVTSGMFTLEAHIRPTAAVTGRIISAQHSSTVNAVLTIRVDPAGSLTLILRNSAGAGTAVLTSATGLVDMTGATRHHVAATRNASNRIDIWLDGVSVANTTSATSPAGAPAWNIGSQYGLDERFKGYIDQVRITEGACRYTGAFTAPTTAYPRGGTRRRAISVAGASGAGTNYQILLKVGESSGSSSPDFVLSTGTALFPSGKGNAGDVSFTDAGGAALSYWVEQVAGTTPNRVAWIWVKVPADLGTNQTVYCVYSLETPASGGGDGNTVFELFDDFDGTSLDVAKWEYKSGSGGLTVSGGEAVLTGAASFRQIGSKNTQPDGREVVGRISPPATSLSYVGDFGFREYASGDNCMFRNDWDTQGTSEFLQNNSVLTQLDARYQDAYYRIRVRRSGGASSVLINDVQKASGSSGAPTAVKHIPLLHVYDSGTTAKADWIAVKKYQTTEPTFSSAGAEESVTASNTASGFQSTAFGAPTHRRAQPAAGFQTGGSGIHSSPLPAVGFQTGALGAPTLRLTQPATSVAPTAAFGTPGVFYKVAGFKATEFGTPTIPLQATGIAPATAFGQPLGKNLQRPAGFSSTQFGLADVKPIGVGFLATKFGISSIPLVAREIAPNTSFGVAKGKAVLQVAGISSTQIGAPRAVVVAHGAGFAPTAFGTPLVDTHVTPQTAQAASLGPLTKIPGAFYAFAQTGAASGNVVTAFGVPMGVRYAQPNLGQRGQAFGFQGTVMGSHAAKWRQTGLASGFASFQPGTPTASKQQRATGFAGTSLGAPTSARLLGASGFANTVLNVPLVRLTQSASTALQGARFGSPTAVRPGAHHAYGFTCGGRFGQPRAALRINRLASGFASTALGAPTSVLRYRAQHLAPTTAFGTPLLKRTPLC